MSLKIALSKGRDTRWISILLGTNREAKAFLRELLKEKDLEKERAKEEG
jgi:hypothetical protein